MDGISTDGRRFALREMIKRLTFQILTGVVLGEAERAEGGGIPRGLRAIIQAIAGGARVEGTGLIESSARQLRALGRAAAEGRSVPDADGKRMLQRSIALEGRPNNTISSQVCSVCRGFDLRVVEAGSPEHLAIGVGQTRNCDSTKGKFNRCGCAWIRVPPGATHAPSLPG